MAINRGEFEKALTKRMREAASLGHDYVDINAGDLHREVGIYPDRNHSMPTCCRVMRAAMRAGDVGLSEPPKGNGASLTIRYQLPRH